MSTVDIQTLLKEIEKLYATRGELETLEDSITMLEQQMGLPSNSLQDRKDVILLTLSKLANQKADATPTKSSSVTHSTEPASKKRKLDSKPSEVSFVLTDEFRVTVKKWNGKDYVDFRKFYLDKESKEYKPAKQGVSMPVSLWAPLKAKISEIDSAIEAIK